MKRYDLVIVGGGPGGLAAGIYAARGMVNCVLLEKGLPGGQMLNTDEIENYPGFESILGMELSQKMEAQARKQGLQIETADVQKIRLDGKEKVIITDGEEYRAKAVIVATGGLPKKLGLKGEKEFAGKGVSYCATCDGAFFKGQELVVIGGGDSAVQEGDYLTRFASKVYLVHRRDELRASKVLQKRFIDNPRTEVLWSTIPIEIYGGRTVKGIRLKSVKTGEEFNRECRGVFIYVGFLPNSDLFEDEIEKDENGFLIVNREMKTSLPGVFAVGDVISKPVRQIAAAVGEGATAEHFAEHYIANY
ncbi:MAG: thioredoxin-disulfide reductase [Acidobacteriota bacterium]